MDNDSAGDYSGKNPGTGVIPNIKSTFNLNEAIFFNNNTSPVDIRSETPDLNSSEKKFETYLNTHVIFSGDVNREMYSETPDLTSGFKSHRVNG